MCEIFIFGVFGAQGTVKTALEALFMLLQTQPYRAAGMAFPIFPNGGDFQHVETRSESVPLPDITVHDPILGIGCSHLVPEADLENYLYCENFAGDVQPFVFETCRISTCVASISDTTTREEFARSLAQSHEGETQVTAETILRFAKIVDRTLIVATHDAVYGYVGSQEKTRLSLVQLRGGGWILASSERAFIRLSPPNGPVVRTFEQTRGLINEIGPEGFVVINGRGAWSIDTEERRRETESQPSTTTKDLVESSV